MLRLVTMMTIIWSYYREGMADAVAPEGTCEASCEKIWESKMADALSSGQFAQLVLLGSSLLCCTLLAWDIFRRREEEQERKEMLKEERRLRLAAIGSGGGRTVTVTKTQRLHEEITGGAVTMQQTTVDKMLTDLEKKTISGTEEEPIVEEEVMSAKTAPGLQASKPLDSSQEPVEEEDEEMTSFKRRVREESCRSEISYTSRVSSWFGEDSRQQVDILPTREGLSDSCVEKLDDLRKLGMECNLLSGSFDQWAVACRDLEKEDSQDGEDLSLNLLLKKKEALRAEWAVARRLYYCLDVHLKNASAYQQFYHDVDEVSAELTKLSSDLNTLTSTEPEEEITQQQAKEALKNIEKSLAEIQLLNVAIEELTGRSETIVPVRLRTDPLKEPVPVRSLCSFKTPQLSVIEGEPLFLLDNQDQRLWKVRNSSGVQSEVPAVTVLIPPPDTEASERTASLQGLVKDTWQKQAKTLKERIARLLKVLLQDIIDKDSLLKIIEAGHLDELLRSVETSEGILGRLFQEYGDLGVMLGAVQSVLQNSTDEGQEDEGFPGMRKRVLGIEQLLLYYQLLHGRFDDEASAGSSGRESDWDTLDDAHQAQGDDGMEVSIQRETESAQVEGFTQSRQEVKQTFSIRGVIDPTDRSEISMQDAINKGIIDQENGLYVNSVTGESLHLPEAMNQGLIVVDSTQTMRSREKTSSVGLMSVTISRETRPYTIRQVRDPRSDAVLSVTEAVDQGILDTERNVFKNPETDEEMSVENAIETGDLIVEYDPESEKTEPEVITKHFAVTSVRDRVTGKRLKFHEAAEKGIINKESGEYTDQTTGEAMGLSEALRLGLVRARIISDPEQFETMLRERRMSNASTLSSDTRHSITV